MTAYKVLLMYYMCIDDVPAVAHDMFNVLSRYGELNVVVYEDDTTQLHILDKFGGAIVATTFITLNKPDTDPDIIFALEQVYNMLSERILTNITSNEGCGMR